MQQCKPGILYMRIKLYPNSRNGREKAAKGRRAWPLDLVDAHGDARSHAMTDGSGWPMLSIIPTKLGTELVLKWVYHPPYNTECT